MINTKQHNSIQTDNRGSGLIMVLIAIAFLSILSGILMFASYGGYKMKVIDKQNKDNFYDVEMVLDEINAGLQKDVSQALTEAYQEVMQNYSLYETPAKRNQALYDLYYAKVQATGNLDGDINKLIAYLSADSKGDGDVTRAAFDSEHGGTATYGAIVEGTSVPGEPMRYAVEMEENRGLLLKGIEVTYVDRMGTVAIISTDIRIVMPKTNFSESSAFPDLNHYSVIADKTLSANCFGGAANDVLIKGNVYAEEFKADNTKRGGLHDLPGSVSVTFEPAEDEAANRQGLVVCQKDIQIVDADVKTSNIELWAANFLLMSSEHPALPATSAKAELDGSTYIENDIKLEGLKSSVTLSGSYTGFGAYGDYQTDKDSDKSSAILINGRESSLDLSGLESMTIGGHAYIGSAYKDGDIPEAAENKNVMMGESIAVKSDQLAYLVPAEAMHCEGLDDASAYYTNPIKMTTENSAYLKHFTIDTDCPIKALGGHSLSGYGVKTNPVTIFQYTNAGTLVYYYLDFNTPQDANKYFAAYYGANPNLVDKYTKVYADSIRLADPEDMVYLYLAGNALRYEEDVRANVAASTGEIPDNNFSNMFLALHTKLVPNLSQLTAGEQERSVFNNIISDEALRKTVDNAENADRTLMGDPAYFTTDTGYEVVLTKGDFEINDMTDHSGLGVAEPKLRMVIALGDVTVTKDFYGLILAGGNVTVNASGPDTQVELKALKLDDFTELLMAKDANGKFYALDVFRDGVNYADSANKLMDYGTKEVSLSDLIVYERWSKK